MDIIEELLNLGGSMQQCKVHQKAVEEIEELRRQKQAIIDMFWINLKWHKKDFSNEDFEEAISKVTGELK